MVSQFSRLMVMYFHDTTISGQLGPLRRGTRFPVSIGPICARFPGMSHNVACKRAKPKQDDQVGFRTATPPSYPLGIVFIDFMGALTKSKWGI